MSTKIIVTLMTIWLILSTLVFGIATSPAFASQNNYVDRTQDFWINLPAQGELHLWTDLCDDTTAPYCPGTVDSMLWLYDSNGTLLAANDDSFTEHTGGYSLASTIRISLPAGDYRVRAGVCCGDPTADRFGGNHYYMISNFAAELAPGTPSATWTPTPQPTPTPTPTPTPEPTPTPTPEPTPTPVPDPYLNAPTGLMVTVYTDGNVYLTWNAPEASGTDIERYGVFWTTGDLAGWAVASSETNMGISSNVFAITGGTDQTYTFWVRADNDTLGILSPISTTVSVFVPAPPPPTPSPTPEPTPTPTPEPTPEPTPSPTPTPEPTPTPTPEPPTPSPSVAPTPTPEPSVSPSPEPTPTPSPEVTNEPTPTPEESVSPSPDPSPVPTDTPGPIDPGAAVEAVTEAVGEAVTAAAEAVGEAVTAVTGAVGAAVDTVANLGNDITEEERDEARETIVPAIILTQIASAAAAATRAASGGGGWSGGGGDGPKKGPRRSGPKSGPKGGSKVRAKAQTKAPVKSAQSNGTVKSEYGSKTRKGLL